MAMTTAVSAGLQIKGQRGQAKAVAEASAAQQEQINDQTAERNDTRIKEARELRASLRAQAAESGVSGNSIALLGQDMLAQAGRDMALMDKNRKQAINASQAEARARLRAGRGELWGGLLSTGMNAYDKYQIGKDT